MTPVKTRVVEVAPAPEEGWWSLLQRSVEHTHILTPPSFISTHRLYWSTWVVYSGGKSVMAATGIKSTWMIWPLWKHSNLNVPESAQPKLSGLWLTILRLQKLTSAAHSWLGSRPPGGARQPW